MSQLYPSKPMAEETPRIETQMPTNAGIDLNSLNDLALGPRWSSGPVLENTPRLNFREERPRDDRGPRAQNAGGSAPRRDRRPPRREGDARPATGDASADSRSQRPQRREYTRPAAPPPPFQPVVEAALYPEDGPFKLLGNAIKNSGRTYELFEIARLILEKPERFVIVVHPIEGAQPSALYISQPDNMPFESEEAALNHVFTTNLATFFDVEEVLVDPPKGNFLMVNRCGITGELLAPPNYHKYPQILQAHYAARCSSMPYERFLSRVEGVREKEIIDQWLEKMRKQIRYKLKEPIEGVPAEFDTIENARFHLVLHAKDKLVKVVQTARFEGKSVETMPAGIIRKSLETVIEQQRRFPLDTANNLRGRLRRMSFSVYKKGSKGISYVCAIRRNFRKPGETFTETIQQLIEFVEAHPGFPASELPKEYLGTQIPEGGETTMAAEDLERVRQLRSDLRWLITSGYVTEYSSGKLFAPPPQTGPAPADEEAPAEAPAEGVTPVAVVTTPVEAPADIAIDNGDPVVLADAFKAPEVAPVETEAPAQAEVSAPAEAPATAETPVSEAISAPATEEKPAS